MTAALLAASLLWTLARAPRIQAAAAAEPAKLDIRQITLDNGLRLYVVERTASPTFAALFQFAVGGAMDPKGRSGIAHLLEHMMFKGSRTLGTLDPDREAELMTRLSELWHELHRQLDLRDDPFREADEEEIARLRREIEAIAAAHKQLIVKNEFDELMTRAGGVSLNAGTGNDSTVYFLQLPANRLELWFELESDRLLNPVFREFYSERDVVMEERRLRTENRPTGKMSEALESLMYTAHPYGTPVVGWPRDLERLTREDALDAFRTFYSPSNCVMVLVGDVDADEVGRLAEKYFAPWKRQELPRLPITAEPEQEGERRRVVEFNAEPQLMMGWVTVPEGHPDQYPLDVLASILGGLASSRLETTVVQHERLAAAVDASHPTQRHSGFFFVSGRVADDHATSELETAIEREIARIVEEGVTDDELERTKITTEVSRVRSLKSNLGLAFQIASSVGLTGDTDYLDVYEKRIAAVTDGDVRRVAERYLTPRRKNVVALRPDPDAATPGGASGTGVAHQHGAAPGEERGSTHSAGFVAAMERIRSAPAVELKVPEIGRDVRRVELASGMTVFVKRDPSAPSVSLALRWLGGSNTAPLEDLPAFELAGDLLDQGGTEELDPIAFQQKKDALGMSFSISMGATQSSAGFWSLRRNFDEALALALEALMRPRLDADRLATLKGQYVDRMRQRFEVPSWGAYVLQNHVFYHDHPRLGYTPRRQDIEKVSPDDVRRIWRRYLGKDNLYITAVGDFDPDWMIGILEERLGSWRDAEDKSRDFLAREPVIRPGIYIVEKELPQPAIRFLHQITVDRTAPAEDHAAMEILNDILGGSGFRSRLMERLRSDEGLTYGVSSYLLHEGRPGVPGALGVSYQTRKSTVARSIDSVLEEIHKLLAENVSEAEVEEQIDAWRNRFIFRYTDDFFSVRQLMSNELDDRPYDYDRRVLDRVQRVTVEDVQRVARKYLKPEHLTLSVFGKPTDDDRRLLAEEFGRVEVLSKEQVFGGGYQRSESAEPTEEEADQHAKRQGTEGRK